ncbi:MAG: CBS domain-containing protein [Firmicutes bacterium]|nr:CBS domain-containing protein [Bacillota bacterium]
MNILFFLTPKNDVAFIYEDFTLRQVLEKMENNSYTAVPIISREGKYIGTLTEGDLLWGIKNQYDLDLKKAEDVRIADIPRRIENAPVDVSADVKDVVEKALKQNFVPVIDDRGIFIGIITRKSIIRYFYDRLEQMNGVQPLS